jgi:hypothetical protein
MTNWKCFFKLVEDELFKSVAFDRAEEVIGKVPTHYNGHVSIMLQKNPVVWAEYHFSHSTLRKIKIKDNNNNECVYRY